MPKIDWMELHMASAHFPIALLMSSALFAAAGSALKKEEFRITSYWIQLLGVLSGVGTLGLGIFGNPFFEDIGWIGNPWRDYGNPMANRAVIHSWIGIASLVLFGALAVWRIRRRDSFSRPQLILYWSLTTLSVGLIGWAGYLGAHVMD